MYYNIQSKKIVVYFIVLVILSILQGLFFRFFDYFINNINLAFTYFIFLSFYFGKSISYKMGMAYGLILDCFGATFGFYSLIFTVLGYVIGLFSGKFFLTGIILPVMFSFIASIVYFFLSMILLNLFYSIVWQEFLINSGVQTLISLILSPLVAYIFRRYLFRRVGIVNNERN